MAARSPALSSRRIPRRSVASWVLYDLANTCFSLGVITLFFPGLARDVFRYTRPGEVDGVLGPLAALAAAIVFVMAPVLGALSDQAAPLMARLAPPRYYGQFFGLYSMVGRFGAIVGPAMWAITVHTLGWGQPAGVMFLLLWIVIAFMVLRRVDDAPRSWAPEDLPDYADEAA